MPAYVDLGRFVIADKARVRVGGKRKTVAVPVEKFYQKKLFDAATKRFKQEYEERFVSAVKGLAINTLNELLSIAVQGESFLEAHTYENPNLGTVKGSRRAMQSLRFSAVYPTIDSKSLKVTGGIKKRLSIPIRRYSPAYMRRLYLLSKSGKISLPLSSRYASKQLFRVTGNQQELLEDSVFSFSQKVVHIKYPRGFSPLDKAGRLRPRYTRKGKNFAPAGVLSGVEVSFNPNRVKIIGVGAQSRALKKMIVPGFLYGKETWMGVGEPVPSGLPRRSKKRSAASEREAAAMLVQNLRHRPYVSRIAKEVGLRSRQTLLEALKKLEV